MDLRDVLGRRPVTPERRAAMEAAVLGIEELLDRGDDATGAVEALNAMTGHSFGLDDFRPYCGAPDREDVIEWACAPPPVRLPAIARGELVEIVRRILADPADDWYNASGNANANVNPNASGNANANVNLNASGNANANVKILQVEKKIRSRVKKQMEKTQKEYYLNEQMQAIQKELGGGERDEFKNEIQEIEEKLKTKRMSKEAAAQGQEGAQEAEDDAPDERGGDRRAQLHRLDPRRCPGTTRAKSATTSTRPRRSSTRTTTA